MKRTRNAATSQHVHLCALGVISSPPPPHHHHHHPHYHLSTTILDFTETIFSFFLLFFFPFFFLFFWCLDPVNFSFCTNSNTGRLYLVDPIIWRKVKERADGGGACGSGLRRWRGVASSSTTLALVGRRIFNAHTNGMKVTWRLSRQRCVDAKSHQVFPSLRFVEYYSVNNIQGDVKASERPFFGF